MIKRLFALTIVFAILSFYACKTEKKEEPKSAPASAKPAAKTPQGKASKETREKRRAQFQVVDLELYNETNLVTTVPPDQFDSISTVRIKAGKQELEVSAILVSDLLNKYNLTGKNVVFSGPMESVALSWEEAIDGQVYVAKGQASQFRLLDQKRTVRLPGQLTRIQVTEKDVAITSKRARKEKS